MASVGGTVGYLLHPPCSQNPYFIQVYNSTQSTPTPLPAQKYILVNKPIMVLPFPLSSLWFRSGHLTQTREVRSETRAPGPSRVSRKNFLTLEETPGGLMSSHLCCFYIWTWCLEQLQPFETWRNPAWGERSQWQSLKEKNPGLRWLHWAYDRITPTAVLLLNFL